MKLSFTSVSALTVAGLGFAPRASAQGCVLCYTSLAGAGPNAMRAFMMAMFALLIPALLLFIGVFLVILRGARADSPASGVSQKRGYLWRFVPHSIRSVEGRA